MKRYIFSVAAAMLLGVSIPGTNGNLLYAASDQIAQQQVIKGGKPDNSGEGGYYPWEDSDAVRGLKFHAKKAFVLKSVKLYNAQNNAGYRVISLLDRRGKLLDKRKVFVADGESRVVLNFKIPKGRGYTIVADIHKGLYRNTNVTGYPYKIGNVAKIVSNNRGSKRYYHFFYDWEVAVSGNQKVEKPNLTPKPKPQPKPLPKTEDAKAYIPALDFSKQDVYGSGKVVTVSDANELENAIANLTPNTTVILADGLYDNVHIVFPKGVHHVTIKAAHKGGAKISPLGKDDDAAFILNPANRAEDTNHHINFIDLVIAGSKNSNKQFLRTPSARRYDPAFIYIKGVELKDLWMGIYSGLHSHDWTVDSCTFSNSKMSHGWYMLGWHLAVINSTFTDGSHDYLAIRGYYPAGELYDYYDDGEDNCKVNIFVENRKNRKGFLPKDEWTHLIKGNRFLSWHMHNPQRSNHNTHVAIAYGLYDGDNACNAERVYLPPQNIEISSNIFDNSDEAAQAVTDAILIDAREGINNAHPASINGIQITDNIFKPQKSQEKFIAYEGTLDIASIEQHGNQTGKKETKKRPKPQKTNAKTKNIAQTDSVTNFGFKGYKSANIHQTTSLNVDSINRAIQSVSQKGGGVVTIPAGTVEADAPIEMANGVILEGTLSQSGENLTNIVASFSGQRGLIIARKNRNFVIQNLNLDIQNNNLTAISLNEGGIENFMISHNTIQNVGAVKFEVAAANGTLPKGFGPKDGISLHDWDENKKSGFQRTKNFTIQNNTIKNYAEHGVDLRYVENYLIKDNYFENGVMGIDNSTGARDGEITGNEITNMVTGAKIIGSRGRYNQNLKFHDNNIHDNPVVTYYDEVSGGTYTGGDGLALQFPQQGVEVYNNHIDGDKDGIVFWSGARKSQINMHDNH